MKGTIERYLDRVMAVADFGDDTRSTQIRAELRDHLEQKVESLQAEGYDGAEAIVKAVEDHGNPVVVGYRLRPWRMVDVRVRGTARGVIAIGPKAYGVVAIGGVAVGVFAFGGLALGIFSCGGLALALLLSVGGCAAGGAAYGGLALGLVAFGGMAVGVIASGGTAAGLWVPGAGQALWSHYTWQTAPAWWHGIGHWLSYGSAQERMAFFRLHGAIGMAYMVFLAVVITMQAVLMSKERERVRRYDPTLIE
ncbi:MAG: permease prefix domain 1-containing protein [FCB group bacterium]|jgi:hypothetical protein|nr:permease prefix domain 1-containing protein [FCB group bacterium]